MSEHTSTYTLQGKYFVAACLVAAAAVLALSERIVFSRTFVALEVFATIAALFLLGSFRYRLDKNAISFGMSIVVVTTFCRLPTSSWHLEVVQHGWWWWVRTHVLSFDGLDALIHLDTMLFILGLTFFVAVVAQTRLLESMTFVLLRRYRGAVLPTLLAVVAAVGLASGILDGVSMIGLTIRTIVVVMMLASAPTATIRYAVMVCTVVTTVCGIWLAYGEPPNLIMKANLYPFLDNEFFLRYCLPAAAVSYFVVAWQLRRRIGPQQVDIDSLDLVDANIADVRFLQAERHGDVMTPVELVEGHASSLNERTAAILERLRQGEALGLALVHEDVPVDVRRLLLGHFVSDELADGLDRHYLYAAAGRDEEALRSQLAVEDVLGATAARRRRAQRVAALGLLPFAALLFIHALNHEVPLFLASFAAFVAAFPAIGRIPRTRRLALREAAEEYAEYYFLVPLFLSISLLTAAGFFDSLQTTIATRVEEVGHLSVALEQYLGATALSAVLDNNVVADFASRALQGLNTHTLRFFAAAQIFGYAIGGCWTHIGCAQSVVAFAFIQREVDDRYTPVQWIHEMTPVILVVLAALGGIVCLESWFLL